MLHRESSGFPFDIISMDHLVVDQKSGKFSMLVIIDEFSKFAVLVPVTSLRAKITVDNIVNRVFLKYGMPNNIHTDNGTSFVYGIMKELTKRCGIIKL